MFYRSCFTILYSLWQSPQFTNDAVTTASYNLMFYISGICFAPGMSLVLKMAEMKRIVDTYQQLCQEWNKKPQNLSKCGTILDALKVSRTVLFQSSFCRCFTGIWCWRNKVYVSNFTCHSPHIHSHSRSPWVRSLLFYFTHLIQSLTITTDCNSIILRYNVSLNETFARD